MVEADLGGDDTPDTLTARGTEGPDAFKAGITGVTGVGARTEVFNADATGDVHAIAGARRRRHVRHGHRRRRQGRGHVRRRRGDDTLNYSGTNGPTT